MFNLVTLMGRIAEELKIVKIDDDKTFLSMPLEVQRTYKNSEGVYEYDIFNCVLWSGIASQANEYIQKGDLVAVKGRLQTRSYEDNGETKTITEVIVDRVTSLGSEKAKENISMEK